MAAREGGHFHNGERAYILGDDYLPFYVGEGVGDLDYKDAIELSIIKRTSEGLPAAIEYISAIAPPPKRPGKKWNASYTSRASRNNPYICAHCAYKTTRYGNMVKHLKNSHGDISTDPRDNR